MAGRHQKTLARRAALQLLYSAEITATPASVVVESGIAPEETGSIDDYARRLIAGVEQYCDDIDSILDEVSENWSIGRMPCVDRSILHIALYEMIYVAEVPISVSINEAVELAKDFGGQDESHRFVNGLLGTIAKKIECGQIEIVGGPKAEDDGE